MMDIKLGSFPDLETKFSYSAILALKTDVIKGFCFWHADADHHAAGEIVVVATRELTDEEKITLIESIRNLEVDRREEACRAFNTDLAIAGMNSAFTVAERIALMPYLAGVKEYMNYPGPLRNFSDLKLLLLGLVEAEVATQGQYEKIKSVLLEQGINLEAF